MATINAYANRGAMVKRDYPNSNFAVPSLINEPGSNVLTKFDIPASVRGKEITDIKIWTYAYVEWDYKNGHWINGIDISVAEIKGGWDESTVTYNTIPAWVDCHTYPSGNSGPSGYEWIYSWTSGASTRANILENGISFRMSYAGNGCYTYTSQYQPYLEISYIEPTIYLTDVSPQSGYVPKNQPTTLTWKTAGENYVYGGVTQTSATIEWRAGSSGTINRISLGSAQQYTIPAGTFTADEIQWRVTVVASGQTKTSPWYTLSTVETLSTASTISPVSGFVDSTKPITFSWDHVIETGTTQTGFELQAGTDGSSFATVAAETTANEFVTIPAGTFTPGPLYWRVRTYNTDGNPGKWSAVAQVTAIGAPNAPVVTLDDTSPRPSVRWQASGQQAYEVTVDGVSVARAFGTAKTYRSETYLTDGQHTISVRVQNQYGLWSERGTVSVQIANTAGSAITLTAAGGGSASLTWSTNGIYDKYYVYRDGELLAKTTATSYDDALTNGAHIYQVRGAYDTSGDYGLSNAVNVVIQLESTNIAAVDGTVSIDLPYSETNNRQTTTSVQRQMSTLYFAGSPLPSMEVSEWTDRKMTISAALKAGESLTQIMALVGKLVCARDQYGNCVIGPLPGWTVCSYEMYTTLQATIQDVNWREAIKHDPIT